MELRGGAALLALIVDSTFPPLTWRLRRARAVSSPKGLRVKELTVAVLLPWLAARLCPIRLPEDFEIESQARPAAFEAAGGSCLRAAEDLGDFDGLLPSLSGRNVVSIRFLLLGLGDRDFCSAATGTGNTGGEYDGEVSKIVIWDMLDGRRG